MGVVMQPHAAQIISLLRLLNYDGDRNTDVVDKQWRLGRALPNHLIQVGTGEGKSILLGMLAVFLALLGFDVCCACYSDYLQRRDYNSFKDFFIYVGVDKKIEYSTLTDLSGQVLNEAGDIRKLTAGFASEVPRDKLTLPALPTERLRCLLIDEVDVFFSKDFYGATYDASTTLQSDEIFEIVAQIWNTRFAAPSFAELEKLPAYRALEQKHRRCFQLIKSSFKKMMEEVQDFDKFLADENHKYSLIKNEDGEVVKIGYKLFGSIQSKLSYGYQTMFAYFNEFDCKTISLEVLKANTGISLNCGQFSYAEIPKPPNFDCILGVTGTLRSLSQFERNVVENEYAVSKYTYTPPMYGDSNLIFVEKKSYVKLDTSLDAYFQTIARSIDAEVKFNRPVLVFFETAERLNEFVQSHHGQGLRNFEKIEEGVDKLDFYVKTATIPGKVSLLHKIYGRGVDFNSLDPAVEQAKGIHVIQTFLSQEWSEEIQIKGRTARQGKSGSYSLVLLLDDLIALAYGKKPTDKKELKEYEAKTLTYALELKERNENDELYKYIHTKRLEIFEKESGARQGIKDRSLEVHKASVKYRQYFDDVDKNASSIIEFLTKENFPKVRGKSRIVCVSDATGSLGELWKTTKLYIKEMLRRIAQIAGQDSVELQWVAYRDYSEKEYGKDKVNMMVEQSPWTHDGDELYNWVAERKIFGGGDYPEAIEQGLKVVNDEHKVKPVSRVILIADYGPHMEGKGGWCAYHKINLPTDFVEQTELLRQNGIPVYSFYLSKEPTLVQTFQYMSEQTGGKASYLQSVQTLTDTICETVLHDVGSDAMVKEYRMRFSS